MYVVKCLESMTASEGLKSQLPAAANGLTINIWDTRFHSWQKNPAARGTDNCPEGEHKQETGRKTTEYRDCQKQKVKEAAFLSFACLSRTHLILDATQAWVALLKGIPLGCSFCCKGNWLWDTAKTCYQRTAAGITDANNDAGYRINHIRQTQNNTMWSFCHAARTVLQKVM